MIRCFRCNKEISKVEDIGRIVRKAHYESHDFCLCSDCVDYFDKAAEDDLIEWYRLINAKKCQKEEQLLWRELAQRDSLTKIYNSAACRDLINKFLEELENYGAFSDEGIMPGCHSKYDDYDIGVKPQYYEWLQEVGYCITLLRGMYDMTLEKFAEDVNISEDIVERIENGINEDEELMNVIKKYFYNKIKIESNNRRLPF